MKGSGGKSPSVQWYYKDWLSDRKLQRAHPTSRGIWMNLLMHMIDCSLDGEDCQEGMLEDVSITELMQLGSCDEACAWRFIEDALKHQFCNIELDKNRTFHIMSRRLSRDIQQRRKWREKKRKQRDDRGIKNDVPPNVPDVSLKSPTVSPIPSPTLKSKKPSSSVDEADKFYITKKGRKLNGKRYQSFIIFWEAFDYKSGKAEAADAWLDIPSMTNGLVGKIIDAAKKEAARRPKLKADGKTPKMAQGWLSGKRWEDEIPTAGNAYGIAEITADNLETLYAN